MKASTPNPRVRARSRPIHPVVKADSVNPSVSAVCERYAYDGFGREISAPSPVSRLSSFAFSTKQLDAETGMNYYGNRYYAAGNGRWINRDPIKEAGGLNVYAMVGNDAVMHLDVLGAISAKERCEKNCTDEANKQKRILSQLTAAAASVIAYDATKVCDGNAGCILTYTLIMGAKLAYVNSVISEYIDNRLEECKSACVNVRYCFTLGPLQDGDGNAIDDAITHMYFDLNREPIDVPDKFPIPRNDFPN